MEKRVHMATKKFYKPFVFVFLGIILGLSVFGSYKYSYTIKDYAVETSLQEMINHSDFILVGKFTDLVGTWNRARDLNNPKLDSSDNYYEDYLYGFDVVEILKGDNTLPNRVIIAQEHGNDLSGSFIIDERYVEIDFEKEYIVFCSSITGYDYLFQPFDPCYVINLQGKSITQSNLVEKGLIKDPLAGISFEELKNIIKSAE